MRHSEAGRGFLAFPVFVEYPVHLVYPTYPTYPMYLAYPANPFLTTSWAPTKLVRRLRLLFGGWRAGARREAFGE